MGHIFSCFKTEASNANATTIPAPIEKDEVTEILPTPPMSTVTTAEYPQQPSLQPLLCSFDSQINGNRANNCHNHYLYTAQNNAVTTSAVPVETNNLQKTVAVTQVKSQKTFYQKLPSIPRSMSSIGSGDPRVSEPKINSLFDQYKDSTEDCILSEGIEKLCEDMQLSPDEYKVLVLAWRLNASQMCCFTRSEFVQGLKIMKTDSVKGIQNRLNELTEELQEDGELFRDFYRFTFKFGLDVTAGQRILPMDVATVLWRLVFTDCEPPILSRWLCYLENSPHVRGIPKDTWYMFLNFCETVGMDLSSYDDTEAWPSLFDDFVEYENDQMNQNISKTNIKMDN